MILAAVILALATYGPAVRNFTPTAYLYTATAVFTLPTGSALNDFVIFKGSDSATVYITHLEKDCTVATAAVNWTNVMVRRTSETGGTFTQWSATAFDSKSPAPTAVMGDYHLGLTSGNSGGSVFMQRYVDRIPVNSSAVFEDIIRDSWGQGYARQTHYGQMMLPGVWQGNGTPTTLRPASPLVLRGSSDILGLTTSFAPPNGITCRYNLQWYEVPNTN